MVAWRVEVEQKEITMTEKTRKREEEEGDTLCAISQ
jgi:hypothetical protein